MCRKLTTLSARRGYPKTLPSGLTLTEVVVASALLLVAVVPILKALTSTFVTTRVIEQKTLSLILAQAKLDEIRARSIYDYSGNFNEDDSSLTGAYLANITDTAQGSDLRQIEISVGYDENGNGTLQSDEIEVTLATLLARRWL